MSFGALTETVFFLSWLTEHIDDPPLTSRVRAFRLQVGRLGDDARLTLGMFTPTDLRCRCVTRHHGSRTSPSPAKRLAAYPNQVPLFYQN